MARLFFKVDFSAAAKKSTSPPPAKPKSGTQLGQDGRGQHRLRRRIRDFVAGQGQRKHHAGQDRKRSGHRQVWRTQTNLRHLAIIA